MKTKKLIYGGLFLALVGIGFVGCQKEVIQPNNSQTEKNHKMDNSIIEKSESGSKCTRKWFESNGGNSFCCKKSTTPNCYDDVYINPKVQSVIADISDASNENDSTQVINIIHFNYNLLSDFIPKADLDLIISGELSVRTKGDFETNGTVFLILTDDGIVYHVYPFVQ